MRRPKPGDRVLTLKVNVSEIARTNQTQGQHPYDAVLELLDVLLTDMAADPAICAKSIVWNGVDCGDLKLDWRPA